jgi:hypothetical protein
MKPTIKLGFTDYFKPIDEFFTHVLSQDFHIIRDDENPEYLIFCDENFGTDNKKFDNRPVTKIFYTGENRRPWNYNCHFAVSFEHMEGPQYYRLPLFVVDEWVYRVKLGMASIFHARMRPYVPIADKFCSFIVKNGGCDTRNNAFDLLSRYKRVDSPGAWKNNCPRLDDTNLFMFHTNKIKFMSQRKFNLCYENSSYPGYATEKIYQALYAGTVPIYWGSPTIALDFNPKAFVNRHDFDEDYEMFQYIQYLDQNDSAYNEMRYHGDAIVNKKAFELNRLSRWFKRNIYRE